MKTLTHPEYELEANGLGFGVLEYGASPLAVELPGCSNPAAVVQVPGTSFATAPIRSAAMVPANGLRW